MAVIRAPQSRASLTGGASGPPYRDLRSEIGVLIRIDTAVGALASLLVDEAQRGQRVLDAEVVAVEERGAGQRDRQVLRREIPVEFLDRPISAQRTVRRRSLRSGPTRVEGTTVPPPALIIFSIGSRLPLSSM